MSENELSRIVFDCALKVHQTLGPGLLESAYEECLYFELKKTGLRIEKEFGLEYLDYLQKQSQKFLNDDLLSIENDILKPTAKGKFLTDGIASDLFYLNLE